MIRLPALLAAGLLAALPLAARAQPVEVDVNAGQSQAQPIAVAAMSGASQGAEIARVAAADAAPPARDGAHGGVAGPRPLRRPA